LDETKDSLGVCKRCSGCFCQFLQRDFEIAVFVKVVDDLFSQGSFSRRKSEVVQCPRRYSLKVSGCVGRRSRKENFS